MDYLSPDMLLTTIVNKMGLNLSNYYKWLYDNRLELPSSNYFISSDKNGKLYWTDNLEGAQKDFYELREKMQYSVLIDD